ncbi:uncharacterized protein LOC121382904 [Gigantopelta aegis]|uniref:uncharacterized protein LOC121382904 n=1 Tax=Gigantopelta aegis TaxID=1735272 RepID=UPI001B88B7E8|nr:uncharacterized protein LOC121382904 [Gigantopelta aegis]
MCSALVSWKTTRPRSQMELLRIAGIVALGLLLMSGVARCDGEDSKEKDDSGEDMDKCFTMDSILDLVKDMEEEMDNPAAAMMEVDNKKKEEESAPQRQKRSLGFSPFGMNGFNQYQVPYLGGSRLLPWLGGYGGGNAGYASGYSNYAYSATRLQSFIQSFTPGRYHMASNCGQSAVFRTQVMYQQRNDYSCVVHDFYKRGTYTTAKTAFMALPFVRVVPVTTVRSVDYVGYINNGYGYTATLCGSCNRGYPQIEIRCNARPYYHLVRRFVFLPQTERYQVNYGVPQDFGVVG